MTELFLEMKLENIVENVLSKKIAPKPINENIVTSNRQVVPPKSSKFRILQLQLGEDDDSASYYKNIEKSHQSKTESDILEKVNGNMKDLFADTLSSNHSLLLEHEEGGNVNPEFVSEDTMAKMGLIQDYSKYLGDDESSNSKGNDDETIKRMEAHRKILQATTKRA